MSQVYKKTIQIRFREADLAGIMFFGNIYGLCHDGLEDFVQNLGIKWEDYFQSKEHFVPLIRSEAQYFSSLLPGQFYTMRIHISQLRESSFEVTYGIFGGIFGGVYGGIPAQAAGRVDAAGDSLGDKLMVQVKTVHVVVNAKTQAKTSIPKAWRDSFSKFYLQGAPQ